MLINIKSLYTYVFVNMANRKNSMDNRARFQAQVYGVEKSRS